MRVKTFAIAVVAIVALLVAAGPEPASGARSSSPVIAAVGDIACKDPPRNNRRVCRYDDVAAAIRRMAPDAFLNLGDVQYEYGRYADFVQNYDVYFGDLLPITYPVPGNHDYGVPDAHGYFRYFGDRAFGTTGYYSFDLGTWHVIGLNSNLCSPYTGVVCGPGDPQYDWLEADLAAHPNSEYPCTLAFFHHPRWDWLKYQNASWVEAYDLARTDTFYRLMYEAGVDVVLAGHDHNYQRYAPSDPDGNVDPARGIVEFIAGTGGRNLNGLGSRSTRPANFVTGWAGGFGVLKLRLDAGSYRYGFVPAPGQPGFRDAGSAACH
jgi:hypothetical protein